jgi:hypothetical protein
LHGSVSFIGTIAAIGSSALFAFVRLELMAVIGGVAVFLGRVIRSGYQPRS